jgi:hypothetical protein
MADPKVQRERQIITLYEIEHNTAISQERVNLLFYRPEVQMEKLIHG